MFNQAIRTIGTGLIITAWLFAAIKNPYSRECACIGLGFFISGSAWPVVEKLHAQILRGLVFAAKEIWKSGGNLFQRNRVAQKED